MQIKVKDTRMHKLLNQFIGNTGIMGHIQIPVAEAKLALVRKQLSEAEGKGVWVGGLYHVPILISEAEKIEVGDWIWDKLNKKLFKATIEYKQSEDQQYFKVLALPEHFSPKHLQAIVDGKLKDGDKVLVECEEWGENECMPNPNGSDCRDIYKWIAKGYEIKFSEYHPHTITLHKVEEKMYTEEQVLRILNDYRQAVIEEVKANTYTPNPTKWFEQNVK